MVPLINGNDYFFVVTNYKINIRLKEIEMSTKMTMTADCVLYRLEERVAGLGLCVVSSGRESSRLRTVCCVFWKRAYQG
jgi:hypothetical protein